MENITKDILKEMSQVETRIEDRLEKASEQSSDQHDLLSKKVDHLDNRISEIEKWKWYVVGAVAVLVFVISNVKGFSTIFSLIGK